MNFQSPQHLGDWLRNNDIDTSLWGRGSAKSVADLWQELVSGDCEIALHPLLRKVQVATLYILQNDHQLIESVQTFADGRKRFRNRPPSEKMKKGETAETAVYRCLQEEIGCTPENIRSDPHLLKTEIILRESPSYPSLASEFTIHTFEVWVVDLPSGSFTTENQAEDDPVRTIGWCWRQKSMLV